jgi:hypothetical protein
VVEEVSVSADTVTLGDRFSLHVSVRLAPGSVAFLPDSILGRGFEPFGRVEWEGAAESDGSVRVTATYPLIAFEVGDVEIPEFEVYAAEATEAVRAGMATSGEPVGRFDTFVDNVRMAPSARMTAVPPSRIAVASVLHAEDMEYGIVPRPVADVAGGDRDWPATLLAVLFGFTLLGVTGVSARDWAASRIPPGEPPPTAREQALEELDRLVAERLPESGRTRDFYFRTSEIARRFVESYEERWGPSWTGTELMDELTAYASGPTHGRPAHAPGTLDRLPDPGTVRSEVLAAETVKFGGVRPEADSASEHAARLRAWIAAAPDPGGADPDPSGAAPHGAGAEQAVT